MLPKASIRDLGFCREWVRKVASGCRQVVIFGHFGGAGCTRGACCSSHEPCKTAVLPSCRRPLTLRIRCLALLACRRTKRRPRERLGQSWLLAVGLISGEVGQKRCGLRGFRQPGRPCASVCPGRGCSVGARRRLLRVKRAVFGQLFPNGGGETGAAGSARGAQPTRGASLGARGGCGSSRRGAGPGGPGARRRCARSA